MPSKLDPKIRDEVEALATNHQDWTGVNIHRRIVAHHGGKAPLSLRMVQVIVKDVHAVAAKGGIRPSEPWTPWLQATGSPQEATFLIQMDTVSRSVDRRTLTTDEAEWVGRLSDLLEGLCPFLQLEFCREYASRKRWANILRVQLYSGDLDAVLAYRPWLAGNQEAYKCAVSDMLVPEPVFRRPGFFDTNDVWREVVLGIFTTSILETVRGMLGDPASMIWLRGNEELITWSEEAEE